MFELKLLFAPHESTKQATTMVSKDIFQNVGVGNPGEAPTKPTTPHDGWFPVPSLRTTLPRTGCTTWRMSNRTKPGCRKQKPHPGRDAILLAPGIVQHPLQVGEVLWIKRLQVGRNHLSDAGDLFPAKSWTNIPCIASAVNQVPRANPNYP